MALRMRGLPFILLKIKSERFRNILINRFLFSFILGVSKLRRVRSIFVGVQVDIKGEGWMVRVVDKCYYCIYERDNLLDLIINYLFGILQVNNY